MIKNLIFDLGNVLCLWEPDKMLDYFVDNNVEKEFLFNEVFLSDDWKSIDRGDLSIEEGIKRFQERAPKDLKATVKLIVNEWWRLVPFDENIKSFILSLKGAGYGVYLLSNTYEVFRKLETRDRIFSAFDGMVLSYEEKVSKPEEEIFRRLYDRYDLDPATCFFVDDLPENIEAARKTGMDGFVYEGNIEKLHEKCKEKGIVWQK